MTADWRTGFRLTDDERQLVLTRLDMALRDAPPDNPLTPPLRAFRQQVAAGGDEIRLPVGGFDLVTMLHWSALLSGLSTTTGRVRCQHCRGLGEVDLPSALTGLAGVFDFDFNLTPMGPPERQVYLDESPDPAVRQRQAAERQAELERKRDALRRSEERSYGILPGTPRAEATTGGSPDHIPAGLKGR